MLLPHEEGQKISGDAIHDLLYGTRSGTDARRTLGFLPFASTADRLFTTVVIGVFIVALTSRVGQSAGQLPWALLALLVVLYVMREVNAGGNNAGGESGGGDDVPSSAPSSDAHARVPEEDVTDPSRQLTHREMVFMPDLYSVHDLFSDRIGDGWRGDAALVRDLAKLRPFIFHDGHTVKTVLTMLTEFYRRYIRMFRTPWVLGSLRNEYTILRDMQTALMNTVHSLYFRKPMPLCRDLPSVTRAILGRTSRMLRILRHKYVDELRGIQTGAPLGVESMRKPYAAHDMFI